MLKTEQVFSTHGVACQEDIDCATQKLTDLLVEGTLNANYSDIKDKVNTKKAKKKTKRKFFIQSGMICHVMKHIEKSLQLQDF